MVELEFEFTLEDDDGNEFVKTATGTSRREAIDNIVQELVQRGTLQSKDDFEDVFDITHTVRSYSQTPWDDYDELEEYLENISGVSYVRYSDPYEGTYSPPAYYLGVESSASRKHVRDEVQSYFDGFDIREERNTVVVELRRSN